MNDLIFQTAFDQALTAFQADEVPVGAVIFQTHTHQIVSQAANRTQTDQNPLAHAELLAIQNACHLLGTKYLTGYSIFVTLEPCAMCAAAISLARLDNLFFGAFDPKTGGICQGPAVLTHAQLHHKPHIEGGINQEICGKILTQFFKNKRGQKNVL